MKFDASRFNVLLFAVTILIFAPTWLWIGEAWLSNPYYSHGPLVLIMSLYFAWVQWRVIASRREQSEEMAKQHLHHPQVPVSPNHASETASQKLAMTLNTLGFLVIVVALAIHLWATLWRAYYLSALMIPLVLLGLIVTLFGWQTARRFWFPLFLLIFMIPLPIVERLGPPLESFAAMSATTLAQWIGIAARNEGSQVFLPNSTFTVGIPCGGLRSIIAIITLVVLLAYITQGRVWARVLILLAAIPIALAANTLRITLLFAIANAWGEGAGLDYFHTWSSPVLFICAFALVLALAKLVGCSQVRWQAVLPG